MFDDPTYVMICWTGAILVLGWTWLPAFISGLGGARYMVELQDSTDFEIDSRDQGFMDWDVRIRNLGYDPHGQGRMRITFAAARWRLDWRLVIFYSRAAKSFLILQKQPPPIDCWTPVILATVWGNGGLLLTNNALTSQVDEGEYTTQGTETTDLLVLSQLHQQQVQRLLGKGYRVETDSSLEVLVAALKKHTGPTARYQFVRQGQTFLALRFVIHAIITFPMVWVVGFFHLGIPLANLLLGLMFSYSDYMMERKNAQELRAKQPVPNDQA